MTHLTKALSSLCLLTAAATAQAAGPGLGWAGSSGTFARSFFPSCTNMPVQAVPGETVTVSVWGDFHAPFALFAASSGSQCLPIPGVGNALILDMPIFTVTFGTLNLVTPCLSCPPAFENVQFTVPPQVPPGASISFQGATFAVNNLSFTVAITGTV